MQIACRCTVRPCQVKVKQAGLYRPGVSEAWRRLQALGISRQISEYLRISEDAGRYLEISIDIKSVQIFAGPARYPAAPRKAQADRVGP